MKVSIAFERASHVNSGTSVDPEEVPWPKTQGRVMRHPLLHLESDPRGEITHYGGLVLAQQFVRRFQMAQRLDKALVLFKRHAPYHESDHVLALAYTLYVDGTCLEDQAVLQGSEAVRRMVGACRIPDPTTAGDFLRRFTTRQDVAQLSGVTDDIEEAVWSKLARKIRRRRKKHEYALVDLDGHIKPLYGVQKEGADFSYDGRWSYQPLVVSLAGSGECLKVVNQPGSARPSDAAAAALKEVLPRVKRHFRGAIVRGDTDFDRSDVFNAALDEGAYFAIGGRVHPNRAALVERIAEENWKPFVPRAISAWAATPPPAPAPPRPLAIPPAQRRLPASTVIARRRALRFRPRPCSARPAAIPVLAPACHSAQIVNQNKNAIAATSASPIATHNRTRVPGVSLESLPEIGREGPKSRFLVSGGGAGSGLVIGFRPAADVVLAPSAAAVVVVLVPPCFSRPSFKSTVTPISSRALSA